MSWIIFILVFISTLLTADSAPSHPYRFEAYPVIQHYYGPIASLDMKSNSAARLFRTRIREQLKEGINFAGQYVVTEIGCGTECQQFIIVNAKNGKVVDVLTARLEAEFKPNSRLMIINSDCLGLNFCSCAYYQIKNGRIIELQNKIGIK